MSGKLFRRKFSIVPPSTDHLVAPTQQQASQMGVLSGQRRRGFTAKLLRLQESLDALTAQVDRLQAVVAAKLVCPAVRPEQVNDGRLATLSEQLDGIDCAIAAELAVAPPDPRRLRDLTAAKAQLLEVERRLAGRPLPPTFRASQRQTPAAPVQRPPPTPL
jgi:hypothetical protein